MPRPTVAARGFSAIELAITIAVAGTLIAVALPGLGAWQASLRARTEINALHHALHLARRESITRNVHVVLCPSSDSQQCRADGDWSTGWLLYVESQRTAPPQRQANEQRLLARRVDPTLTIVANRHHFAVRTRRFRATNGTLVACDRHGRGQGRALIVSYTGRPRARPASDVAARLPCR
ncbi:MAG: GspH/FimT family pseudopilin [Pseudomonadota bacterium]